GFVYILESIISHRYYIGSCIDIERRLVQHNNGKVPSTCNKGPWELRFSQMFTNVTDARKMEYRLKKLKSRKIVERIIQEKVITMD
ncbi:GIY-YIG nuclease family protein, partial [Candidatus Uhrbacteria bacterium]|nr:GIY-YIG nuclease family protein [Candidatus Uhrbacteria bacterium]